MRTAAALIAMLGLAAPAFAQEAGEATVAWIKERAIPILTPEAGRGFEDLELLKKLVGDARIVSLGESTHGSREIFQMKHRLVEFLASEMGFTIFSIEANLPEAYRLNDYVLGGKGDPDELIAGMHFWTWNTHEVKAMVEWMRRFNAAGKGRIEFTGFDMQFPDLAMDEVLNVLDGADEKLAALAEKAYASGRAATDREFGVVTGRFPVIDARGRRLRFRGWIRTEEVTGFAGLWWRCDDANGKVLAFDNMAGQKIGGTRDWQSYSLELEIPKETETIHFGVLMPGTGTAWFDGLEVLLDGKKYESPGEFDFDFESDVLVGLRFPERRAYTADLDPAEAKTGKKSLRLKSKDVAVAPEAAKKAWTDCQDVYKAIVAARADLLKKKPAKDVEWAIVNARLAASAMGLRFNQGNRDAEMAFNVEWILERNPGAKIVLWAHNAHVARLPYMMGRYLDRKFGKSHLPIGFATTRGEYQAVGRKVLGRHPLQEPPADSYEAAFRKTGVPRFILDLRAVDPESPGPGWLARTRPFRSIGSMAMDDQFSDHNLHSIFDAVIYLEETTAARPLR
jgi:erythromycin esterase-like protein